MEYYANMSEGESRLIRRRLVGAWLSTVVSISLVLFLVGVASLLLVNARSVSDYFKENLQISVMMKTGVSEESAMAFRSVIDSIPGVRQTTLIPVEQGVREMSELLGEDFLNVFEISPIPVSIDVSLNADHVWADSIDVIRKEILTSSLVDEVVYQQSLVDKLNTNLGKISMVLGIFIALLLFISFVLINNTIRLNVFSKRFSIHTMKLVGATKAFIRGPFLVQSVFQGMFSALVAIAMLVALLFFIRREFVQLFEIFSLDLLLVVMGIVFASGIIICLLSTYFVVGKLVSLSKDELYY